MWVLSLFFKKTETSKDSESKEPAIKLIDEPAEPIVLQVSPRAFDLDEFEEWLRITNNNLSPEMRLKLMLKNKADK